MSMYEWLLLAVNLAAGTMIGKIVFQSFVVAPTVFGSLDEASARRFLRDVFPRFYRLGLGCGGVMLAALIVAGIASQWTWALVALTTLALVMIALETVSLRIVPTINAARDAGQASRFQTLHRLSVALTVVVLLLCIAAVGLLVHAAGAA